MPAYAIASNIISFLGLDAKIHWQAASSLKSGITYYEDAAFSGSPFYACKLDPSQWQLIQEQEKAHTPFSPFELMALYSARQALRNCKTDIDIGATAFILATTKGNIEWLGQVPDERILLHTSANIIANQLGISAQALTVSHACASGVIALIYALRLLETGKYKNVVVTGCDRFTRFVLKGFQSFQAVSDAPCRPFDAARKGVTLGEAAATIILSSVNYGNAHPQLMGGATSNDANHISGPSRTGNELAMAIAKAIKESGVAATDIGMISAHGTATDYNDEMEAKAFNTMGLGDVPLHSFKGYVGHTLGAAGVLESAMILEALRCQQLIPSAGFENSGVSMPVNVTTEMQPANIEFALKTASGFGGCNAAIIWKR